MQVMHVQTHMIHTPMHFIQYYSCCRCTDFCLKFKEARVCQGRGQAPLPTPFNEADRRPDRQRGLYLQGMAIPQYNYMYTR